MTGHSIVYGFDRQAFTTTNNDALTQKDLSGSVENAWLLKERGATLKQSNFHFGHDGLGKQTNQATSLETPKLTAT